MNFILQLAVIALVVAAVLVIILKFYGQEMLLSLRDRNEEQRHKDKKEIDEGVKSLLSDNREKLELVVKQLKEQLKESQDKIESLQKQNSTIAEQLKNTTETTEKLRVSTEGLKNVLSNNRLRGEWGEQVAEDLLIGAGFVENVQYTKQESTTEGRPDFTILLPDGVRLNVDAKFPLDDLVNYQEASTDAGKQQSLKKFEKSVKKKIRQIASKDYIDPSSQTVDFAVMFVPNEMVFSFIYEKLPEMVSYGNEQKVIMTGPFGFTAMIRLVLQAYKNFHYEQGLQEILGLIDKFQSEYNKFGDQLEKLGRGLDSARRAYEEVEGTRHRQLTNVVEKISEHSSRQEPAKLEKGE